MTDVQNVTAVARGLALVIDDDPVVRMFLTMALNKLGFTVKSAADGMAALEMCMEDVFELVICDMRMPKLSGISFLKNVRMRAPNSARRIVFLTSIDDSVLRRETLEAGALDYLVKPISTAKLKVVVDRIFSEHQ